MPSAPAYCRPSAFASLKRALVTIDTPAGLLRAACSLAEHATGTDRADETKQVLDSIVSAIRQRSASGSCDARLAHLHDMLFDMAGFLGNVGDYYAAENSYLPDVVQTRRGIPITLSLVYKYVAAQVGLKVHGVNAPGHFLVAVEETTPGGEASLMFIDPFYRGEMLSIHEALTRVIEASGQSLEPHPSLLPPASHRDWIARMTLNLQAIYARSGRERDLYAMQELHELVAHRPER